MPLTKIEAEIEIPKGFEFDRFDTKTRVGDYGFGGYQIVHHDVEYNDPRIILRKKPKPAKPAYRVYTHKGSIVTYTQDRSSIGKESNLIEFPNIIFLTDWIEYDPPKGE